MYCISRNHLTYFEQNLIVLVMNLFEEHGIPPPPPPPVCGQVLLINKIWSNYLCTYDLYGPVRKVLDLGR